MLNKWHEVLTILSEGWLNNSHFSVIVDIHSYTSWLFKDSYAFFPSSYYFFQSLLLHNMAMPLPLVRVCVCVCVCVCACVCVCVCGCVTCNGNHLAQLWPHERWMCYSGIKPTALRMGSVSSKPTWVYITEYTSLSIYLKVKQSSFWHAVFMTNLKICLKKVLRSGFIACSLTNLFVLDIN